MKSIAPASVFAFRDAHSDEVCYQTVSKPLEDIIKECGAIVTTLIPEQYKPTKLLKQSHSILGQPLYIARNANGDFLWTSKGFFIIFLFLFICYVIFSFQFCAMLLKMASKLKQKLALLPF